MRRPHSDIQLASRTEFLADLTLHGMDTSGWLYVPASCRNQRPCRLHIAFQRLQSVPIPQLLFGSGYRDFWDNFRA
jgi:hypothetical protein